MAPPTDIDRAHSGWNVFRIFVNAELPQWMARLIALRQRL